MENWIKSHPQDEKDKPYVISVDGTEVTLNDLLKEVRLQTKLSQSFLTKLNKLTIDLLLRKKENLDDWSDWGFLTMKTQNWEIRAGTI